VRSAPGLGAAADSLPATSLDAQAIATLYADAGYGAAVGAQDTVFVARQGTLLLGVVRLCLEDGVVVLRGLQVRREFQGQGIGARLLAACEAHLGSAETFCLPYTRLERFYGAAGFARVGAGALPDFLARRLAAYRAREQDVIAMRRPPG
jgi:GNAT superfamily N-acetyltransferase